MALFEHFPYVNIQNLNLNWIIKVLKDAVAELEVIQSNWEAIKKTANDAKATADTAKTTADTAKATADKADTNAKEAKNLANTAEMNSAAAQDTAVEAQAIANEANETAARAEITAGVAQAAANAAKTTAEGVDAKASTALTNSQQATEIATEADSTANAANKKATTADNKVDALTATVNTVEKTANDAFSLSQTNEKNIAGNEADITELQTRYKRTIGTRQVWTPAQTARLLTAADFERGIYTLTIDYSEDPEILSFFDTLDGAFLALDNLHCYLGDSTPVNVPAIVAQHPTSANPTAIVYVLLPKTQPNITYGNRLSTKFETDTVSRTIGLNT